MRRDVSFILSVSLFQLHMPQPRETGGNFEWSALSAHTSLARSLG